VQKGIRESEKYLWLLLVLNNAATFSASVNLLALTGESGRNMQTSVPMHIVAAPMATKKIRQLANLVWAKLTPYARNPPTIEVRELQT
jgi:hypothetical protein